MVERVARALFAYDIEHHSMQITGARTWEAHEKRHPAYRGLARAAIEAMRDPTPAMEDAPQMELDDESGLLEWPGPNATWFAMIDAALKPEGGET